MKTLDSSVGRVPAVQKSRGIPLMHYLKKLRNHQRIAYGLLSVFSLLLIWWLVTAIQLVPRLFLPAPAEVWHKFYLLSTKGFMDATLWQHLFASLMRIIVALVVAVVVGISLGIWMGSSPVVKGLLDPVVEIYRPIPPLAYLPLLVIWFGIGEFTKIFLIFLAILAPIVIATAHGIASVGQSRQRAALSLGASPSQLLWHITVPAALPNILTGVRIGLGAGWSTLVAAELVAATRGLGFIVQSAAQFLVTDVVVLGIMVIAVIAFALEVGLRKVQKYLTPWYGKID